MSNVAFGGNWSEELVHADHLRDVFLNFEWAIENCIERDVDSDGVREALMYVRKYMEKGAMLAARWEKGYAITNQALRKKHFEETLNLMHSQAGL